MTRTAGRIAAWARAGGVMIAAIGLLGIASQALGAGPRNGEPEPVPAGKFCAPHSSPCKGTPARLERGN